MLSIPSQFMILGYSKFLSCETFTTSSLLQIPFWLNTPPFWRYRRGDALFNSTGRGTGDLVLAIWSERVDGSMEYGG